MLKAKKPYKCGELIDWKNSKQNIIESLTLQDLIDEVTPT